jgi:cysteine desulfurase/selenocysteine lyase
MSTAKPAAPPGLNPPADVTDAGPSLGGVGLSPQGLAPAYGTPDETSLTRLANEIYATPPGFRLEDGLGVHSPAVAPRGFVPAGASVASPALPTPSLGGFGASPLAAFLPDVPRSPVAAPAQVLIPDVPLTTSPSAGSVGAFKGIPLPNEAELRALFAVPDTDAASPEPYEMELVPDVPLSTPPSAGTAEPSPVPLPFDAELKILLSDLSGEEARLTDHTINTGSVFSFLKVLDGSSPFGLGGISVPNTSGPGAAAPGSEPAVVDAPFDVSAVRRDFPILSESVNGRRLVWLDNAATTQKPQSVIDRLAQFYAHENSNIHRAAHELAARATDAYEGARQKVQRFINAPSVNEIVFTRGTTESINLVAATFGLKHVGEGDEIVITHLEHHANIVPWQQLALAKGAKLRVAPVDDRGAVLLEEYGKLLIARTRLVAFTQVSNALGTVTPAKEMIAMARHVGACVLLDGAQSVSHMKVDVQDLDPDFFVFSGHKLFGPTGIGVLWGRKALLDSLPPYQTGGNMIQDVTLERSIFHAAPNRFEAGTGNIADAVGLGAAIDYVERLGLENISNYEHGLIEYATGKLLSEVPGLRLIGTAPEKAGVISLVLKGVPSEEVGARLNKYGIAVRSGHHCAQPILRRFGQETTVRPSFAFYNTIGEIDLLVSALREIQRDAGQSYL